MGGREEGTIGAGSRSINGRVLETWYVRNMGNRGPRNDAIAPGVVSSTKSWQAIYKHALVCLNFLI